MILLSAEKISKGYTDKKLLDGVSLFLHEGDKVGVIGINGAGKSTLLKIIAGMEQPDEGTITKTTGVRISYLGQNPAFDNGLPIIDHVLHGLSENDKHTAEYEAKTILTKLGITDFDASVETLSGGEKKRVAIAAALVAPCEVLIMDEPTNHLDNEMVSWLETYLKKYPGAIIMITHDRYFLERVTNRIVEISRGNLYNYQANYSKYLELKYQREEMEIATERKNMALFKKELEWIRRGARARSTKSRSRIERFEELSARDKPQTSAKVDITSVSSRLGRKTIEIKNISKSYGGRIIVKGFEHTVLRDARIGIVGPNGCGKSTLLKIIAGKTTPDSGMVDYGETVKIGYFAQENDAYETAGLGDMRVIDFVKETAENISTQDGVITASQMLEKFLFPPDLQYNPINRLSGGEKRRLFFLKVLMEAPNILLLDEPTNDLDIETLSIIEDYLDGFNGAVITVSHDRYFLDKVVDTIFAFENGDINQYNGGYTDYSERCAEHTAIEVQKKSEPKQTQTSKSKKLKFSYNEQKEYDSIDSDIAEIENSLAKVEAEMAAKSSDYQLLAQLMAQKEELEKKLEVKMDRWVYLNDLAEKIKEQ